MITNQRRNFIHINEGFECAKCGTKVAPLKKSCRNHCPTCLYSMHVDETIPGDRASNCHSLMAPAGLEYKGSKGYQIVHKCIKCGKKQLNKVADDDDPKEISKINLK
ncbi:RNHCP domain-containing protein [Candidatus Peregrinibacteria bacterium CG22_combo_CG10-13_8_21_14_all_44_10]|nr:MAG: hypothetical protein AUK45_04855 [Candidatus Peregrinibacteria bacterium CG2_30_44_17]PIP66131.1 MAG: RNHCP domain-containing protein [Candidatus Peregrinibacteria bacterium CG22_combo_CG10-13_8_21_14_all_44_10]PIS04294.1 MAG: RNHCP domain-containing protein [Candidatus Peregrinibacteria bacterium CG10_big_fil_rev_8_21_14_0_10_44_7]